MTVPFDDLDSFGMLHSSHYGVLAERAWTWHWLQRELGYSKDGVVVDDGFNVVRELRVSYEFPIDQPGEYGVHVWMERLGRTPATYGFRVCSADGSRTYAHGSHTIVCLDRRTLRPSAWRRRSSARAHGLRHQGRRRTPGTAGRVDRVIGKTGTKRRR